MRIFLGTLAFAFLQTIAIAQSQKLSVAGKVIDEKTKTPLANATVQLNNLIIIADEAGNFSFSKITPGNYDLKVSNIGYADYTRLITVSKNMSSLEIKLRSTQLFLETLEVKALRASDIAPFAKTNISGDEIAKSNLGQDLPVILNQTPSMYISSDAGNGVGYTYMHIRGSDATRINVTINGIPYNDAEEQATYFVDIPDFASSASSIQIQRGVGSSSNGTGAFGASINLSTNEFHEKAYFESNNGFGSFNTIKNTLKFGSGLLDKHFTLDVRLSDINSDGYIDRAFSHLKSMGVSLGYYISKKSTLHFNLFMGKEKTYQAWWGVPQDSLATHRTYNPAGTQKPGTPYNDETDNYWQNHYQLIFNHSFNTLWSFNTAAFLSFGTGFYQNYLGAQTYSSYGLPQIGNDTSDMINQLWLRNYFFGQTISLQYKSLKDEITFGGGWNRYEGQHFADIIWAATDPSITNYRYYFYPALKTDNSIYVKWQHNLSKNLQTYFDVQYRNVYHRMDGFDGSPTLDITRNFNFITPKAGITYYKNGTQLYFSYAMGNKEPNRDDFQASPLEQPKPETLHDFELGFERKQTNFKYSANLYYMLYKNQLVLTGQINDVGAYTRTNVPNSYRIGIELEGSYIFSKWLNIYANFTFSQNKIKSFTEYIDNYDNGGQNAVPHANTDISFSPNVIGGATINIIPVKQFTISLLSKYVSKQYMDNTSNPDRELWGFYTQDVRFAYTLQNKKGKKIDLIAQAINVFNKLYEPNGNTYEFIQNGVLNTQNNYFPMAGTNYMLGLNVSL